MSLELKLKVNNNGVDSSSAYDYLKIGAGKHVFMQFQGEITVNN